MDSFFFILLSLAIACFFVILDAWWRASAQKARADVTRLAHSHPSKFPVEPLPTSQLLRRIRSRYFNINGIVILLLRFLASALVIVLIILLVAHGESVEGPLYWGFILGASFLSTLVSVIAYWLDERELVTIMTTDPSQSEAVPSAE